MSDPNQQTATTTTKQFPCGSCGAKLVPYQDAYTSGFQAEKPTRLTRGTVLNGQSRRWMKLFVKRSNQTSGEGPPADQHRTDTV
jgi:hypothetical protein